MKNTIVFEKLQGNYKQPDTSLTITVYNYHASDVAGSAPNGTLIGSATHLSNGLYSIDLTDSKKVTIASAGLAVAGLIGRLLHGDKALDDSVDTTAIVDDAVTPTKASFSGGF